MSLDAKKSAGEVKQRVLSLSDSLVSDAPTKSPGEATAGYIIRKQKAVPSYISESKIPEEISSIKESGIAWANLGQPIDNRKINKLKQSYENEIKKDVYSRKKLSDDLHSKVNYPYMKDISTPRPRSNNNAQTNLFEALPAINLVLDDLKPILQEYFSTDIRLTFATIRRNRHLPDHIVASSEAYSNYWHLDGHPHDLVKVFISLSDIDESCGPFHWLSYEDTKNVLNSNFDRETDGVPQSAFAPETKAKKFTGDVGNVLICNTNVLLHRAGIPEENKHRDMIILQFAPANNSTDLSWEQQSKFGTPSATEGLVERLRW